MRAAERVLDFFFPPHCSCCGEVLPSGKVFCTKCEQDLMQEKDPHQHTRILSGAERVICAMPYDRRTQAAVLRMKNVPGSAEADEFARLLAVKIRGELGDELPGIVTAVPMNGKKKKKRGHNQAETLAAALAKELGIPYRNGLLVQHEESRDQHTLTGHERFLAAQKNYSAAEGAAVSGRVLIVDDVLTTGATLMCCASLLKQIGAAEVIAAAATVTAAKKHATQKGE